MCDGVGRLKTDVEGVSLVAPRIEALQPQERGLAIGVRARLLAEGWTHSATPWHRAVVPNSLGALASCSSELVGNESQLVF